jgi:hypothetical protein
MGTAGRGRGVKCASMGCRRRTMMRMRMRMRRRTTKKTTKMRKGTRRGATTAPRDAAGTTSACRTSAAS